MSSRFVNSPSLDHHSPKPRSPRRTVRQEAYKTSASSAPASPSCQTDSVEVEYGYPSQPLSARVGKAFLVDATLSDSMREQDDGDPHDLSFPTQHFPRASMVDNLVMSLDQVSSAADVYRSRKPQSPLRRPRGHTKSSSVATEKELKSYTTRETLAVEVYRNGPGIPQADPIPLIFGEEEETKREKAYNAQRALQPGKPMSQRGNVRVKSRSDSNSSSIDLGHLAAYSGRLGPAGNRRSQSFDFGSTRPKHAVDSDNLSTINVSQRGLTGTSQPTTVVGGGQDIARRNSGRSATGNHNKKGRSGTLGAVNNRLKVESPQPYLPIKSPMLDSAETRSIAPSQIDQSTVPRAGFFRRVFGSSNRSATAPQPYSSPSRHSQDRTGSALDFRTSNTPLSKGPRQVHTDPSHNKENQPVISKKPSSFFRRRKKSTSGGVPPPLPLTLDGGLDSAKLEAGAPSPVSSLRAFMDPYLGEGVPKHNRGTSLQSVENANNGQSKPRSADIHNAERTKKPSIPKVKVLVTTQDRYQTITTATTVTGDTEKPKNADASPKETQALSTQTKQDIPASLTMIKLVPQSSGSDTSDYKSAPSTPLITEVPDLPKNLGQNKLSDEPKIKSPAVHISHPSLSQNFANEDMERARKIYDNTDEQVDFSNASAWLGEASEERERLRAAYMSLFDWTNHSILAALRNLCSKLALKGETQQVDRVLDSFARRWCECNVNHGFRSADIVHTVCYSILLLNTDLHLADIGRKMTRAEFVRNAMDAIRENMAGLESAQQSSSNLLSVETRNLASPSTSLRPSVDRSTSSLSTTRPVEYLSRENSHDENNANFSGFSIEAPQGFHGGWESQVEHVLKDFYSSIAREPLPLFGSEHTMRLNTQQSTNNLSTLTNLRRTPSTVSRAASETRGRYAGESRSLGARWASKTRSRVRVGTTQAFGSSRTSIDDQSSAWSPSMSSTWSKASFGKTLTSMSVESFGTDHVGGGYQASIGFANALSQAITRDEQLDNQIDEGAKTAPALEEEFLELYGAPWAKEGILQHKCHLEGVDKRSKDRNWNDCFAVIEKGWMRLFSFSMTAKSLRNKARTQKAGGVVGGGNWQDNAEEVWKFMLRHTIASSLPPPGYSKQRPNVWALSLPDGAVHLFSVGTPDIVQEFVSTANFWSARLSKEPMSGGVSSMEYGWSDGVVDRSLAASESRTGFHSSSPRSSTQLSMRSSIDHGNMRPRLPGDKIHITEWVPPQQSLMASQLLEAEQLKTLRQYVQNVEDELTKHNQLRGPMLLAFSTRHPNSQKAMSNWEKKSSYLLREIVKFRTYIDALESARNTKIKVDRMKKEEEFGRKT